MGSEVIHPTAKRVAAVEVRVSQCYGRAAGKMDWQMEGEK